MALHIDDLRAPRWLEEGMQVWIRYGTGQVLRCTVTTATGDVGRVVCANYGVDRWLRIEDLLVHHTDLHAREARVSLGSDG